MLLLVFFVVGALLSVGPWLIPVDMGAFSKTILSVSGLVVLIVVAVVTVVTKLYHKAAANMAFVRTGAGGARVIKDGGAIVVPVMHQVIPVSLETMRLNVERRGPHALITRDNLRVDLSAEFYIKVQANSDDILQAARSLGGRNVRSAEVSELVQEKLVSALRTVAATKDLHELHSKRDEFASSVQEIVTHDLASNGLTLETVTISSLDQTDPGQLQEQNVFDAQGLRKIAEITQRARVERNEIERESERAVVAKDVSTRKQVLAMQRDQSEFEAEQNMQVSNVTAAKEREVVEFRLAQEEAVARRGIEKQMSVGMSEVARRLAIEQAELDKTIALLVKHREQETAAIAKSQAVEVAERSKQVAVVQKEQERAAAQTAMLDAEAQREAAKQRVLTVQVSSEAEREAQKKLIAAKQGIAENKIREETEADVLAYMEIKKAEAERQAAEMICEANVRRADGERALKMVSVDVDRQQVSVEQARVDVERQSLANRQEFDDAGLKFELEKMRINAEREIRIQTAQAMSQMLAGAQMQIFGDPTTMSRMTEQFMRAASFGTAAEGLMSSLSDDAKGAVGDLVMRLVQQAGGRALEGATATVNGDAPHSAIVAAKPAPQADKLAAAAKS